VHVTWTALTTDAEIGGSPILSYHLQWDKNTNEVDWFDLVGLSTESTQLSFTVTTDVLANKAYKFRVRAKNLYGWGTYSSIQTIYTAQEPSKVTSITTTNSGLDVIVAWDEPTTNYSPILEYAIEIREADNDFSSTAECVGTDPSLRTCTIQMSTLRAAPYSLTYGMLVAARVRSRNAYGWSLDS
jgi:hypothetical protein